MEGPLELGQPLARDQHSYPTQGNLLINHLMDAKVRYVFPTTVESEKNKAEEQTKEGETQETKEETKEEDEGGQ